MMNAITPAKPKTAELLDVMCRLVGKENVLYKIEDRICYAYDGSRQKYLPDIVLRPHTVHQVSGILRYANEHEVPVYPRGAGTGLTGGSVPLKGGIVLDFTRMNRIVEIIPEDLTATIEPGVITQTLQNEVAKYKLFYPPDPASAAFSTIGGNVAECSGELPV